VGARGADARPRVTCGPTCGVLTTSDADSRSLQALLTFAGAEARQRLIATLRSVENPELAGSSPVR